MTRRATLQSVFLIYLFMFFLQLIALLCVHVCIFSLSLSLYRLLHLLPISFSPLNISSDALPLPVSHRKSNMTALSHTGTVNGSQAGAVCLCAAARTGTPPPPPPPHPRELSNIVAVPRLSCCKVTHLHHCDGTLHCLVHLVSLCVSQTLRDRKIGALSFCRKTG